MSSSVEELKIVGAHITGSTLQVRYEVLCHQCELGGSWPSRQAAEDVVERHNWLFHSEFEAV